MNVDNAACILMPWGWTRYQHDPFIPPDIAGLHKEGAR